MACLLAGRGFLVFVLSLVIWLGVPVAAEVPQSLCTLGWEVVTWQNLNPGAGGNIQGIDLDPTTPGRLYLNSDMEGSYRSDDYGQTWQYIGRDLSYSYVNAVAVDPSDPNRVYAGTAGSLEISDDAGQSWRRASEVADAIGQILINRDDPDHIIALPGQRHRWGVKSWNLDRFSSGKFKGPFGSRNYYESRDRGTTWREVIYFTKEGRRDVLSAEFMPGDSKSIYLGTLEGVVRTEDGGVTWTMLDPPADTGDCFGACLSNDGKVLYAVYRVPADGKPALKTTSKTHGVQVVGHSHLFAMRLDDGAWFDLSETGEGFRYSPTGKTLYWRPVIDPASKGDLHRLVIGTFRPQHGLWQINVDWSSGKPKAVWERVLWYEMGDIHANKKMNWDPGWEIWGINAEDYAFTPPAWGDRMLFATGGQTLYVTHPDRSDFTQQWDPRFCWLVKEIDGERFYRTRGQQSVFVFDTAVGLDGRYVVQSVADNCINESFDGGYSWSMRTKPGERNSSRSNSVVVIEDGVSTPIVLAHVAVGWGAAVETGTLWAKRLIHGSPKDTWIKVAGGKDELAGLPYVKYNALVPDPHHPGRLYISTYGKGVFVIDDIEALIVAAETKQSPPRFESLTGDAQPTHLWYQGAGLAVDPIDPDVLWAHGEQVLWLAKKTVDGWRWTKALADRATGEFAVWAHDGKTMVAAVRSIGIEPGHNDGRIDLSTDGGRTWQPLVRFSDIQGMRDYAWYHDELKMHASGLVGYDNKLVFNFVTDAQEGRRTYGVYQAELDDQGEVTNIEDLTADFGWPYPVRNRVFEYGGKRYLYMASRGNGLWRRALDE